MLDSGSRVTFLFISVAAAKKWKGGTLSNSPVPTDNRICFSATVHPPPSVATASLVVKQLCWYQDTGF